VRQQQVRQQMWQRVQQRVRQKVQMCLSLPKLLHSIRVIHLHLLFCCCVQCASCLVVHQQSRRRGVTLVCSSSYAATDTWNTRKLRTAQQSLSGSFLRQRSTDHPHNCYQCHSYYNHVC
jgi:hypothetical protein